MSAKERAKEIKKEMAEREGEGERKMHKAPKELRLSDCETEKIDRAHLFYIYIFMHLFIVFSIFGERARRRSEANIKTTHLLGMRPWSCRCECRHQPVNDDDRKQV